MEGWVCLHRKLLDSQIFANEKALKIWIWLLLKARHENGFVNIQIGKGNSILELKRGQLLFGRFTAEDSLCIDGSTIYRWIQKFKDWEMILIESNSHSTIITICNYDSYNDMECIDMTADEQPMNNKRTADEQPMNTNNNDNNVNNNNNIKQKSILFKNSEYFNFDLFVSKFKNTEWESVDLKYYYESILDWSNSKGAKKQDWIATARNWMRKDKNEKKLKLSFNVFKSQKLA